MDTLNESREFFASLRTPEHAWDLKKILSAAGFPIRILAGETLTFHLYRCNVIAGGKVSHDISLDDVSFIYVSPDRTNYTRVAIISNSITENPPVFSLSSMIEKMREFLPSRFAPPFEWGDFNDVWIDPFSRSDSLNRRFQFLSQIVWETYPVLGLKFSLFHQDEPGPWSLAFSEGEDGRIMVGSVGTSHVELLAILGSLVPVRLDNDRLINKFQEELKAVMKS